MIRVQCGTVSEMRGMAKPYVPGNGVRNDGAGSEILGETSMVQTTMDCQIRTFIEKLASWPNTLLHSCSYCIVPISTCGTLPSSYPGSHYAGYCRRRCCAARSEVATGTRKDEPHWPTASLRAWMERTSYCVSMN